MKDELKLTKKLVIRIIAGACVIALVLSLSILLINYVNKVDQNSIQVTPNEFFCPLGNETDKSVVINLESSNEIFHQDYDAGNMVLSFWISTKPTLDLANTMYGLLQDTNRKNEVGSITHIDIPEKACYIGSVDTIPTFSNQSFINGLDFDLLHTDIELYAWNTEYQLNSGTKGSDIHLVMSINKNLVYGIIQQFGNKKMEMNILYGIKS